MIEPVQFLACRSHFLAINPEFMFGPIRSIAFDFDGTLVNTMNSVALGMQKAVQSVTGKEIPLTELIKSFGPAPRGVLEKWVPKEKVDGALAVWLQFDSEQGPETYTPFPGVVEMLGDLQMAALPFGLFTGRDRAGTLKILDKLGWFNKLFSETSIVCGDDGFKAKPSGEGLKHLVVSSGWSFADTLMVGDHEHDLMAGRDAGTKTAVALWDQTFSAGPTNRARFRETWDRWQGNENIDLRVPKPESLSYWILKDRGLSSGD
jgi:pyrophosphatase PpaX